MNKHFVQNCHSSTIIFFIW